MATERDYQGLYDRIAALRDTVTGRLSSDLISNPQLADALTKQIDDLLQGAIDADSKTPPARSRYISSIAAKYCVIPLATGSKPTGACSVTAAAPARPGRARTPIST